MNKKQEENTIVHIIIVSVC